jgi:hypothetical protein
MGVTQGLESQSIGKEQSLDFQSLSQIDRLPRLVPKTREYADPWHSNPGEELTGHDRFDIQTAGWKYKEGRPHGID